MCPFPEALFIKIRSRLWMRHFLFTTTAFDNVIQTLFMILQFVILHTRMHLRLTIYLMCRLCIKVFLTRIVQIKLLILLIAKRYSFAHNISISFNKSDLFCTQSQDSILVEKKINGLCTYFKFCALQII